MEINNLNKTLTEIFSAKYIIPLYQRNFAWSDEEISQLLVDLYESYSKVKGGNYFIGSLVVLKRRNGDFEVIDGQQRLTVITLIARILGVGFLNEPKLFYDSRPEVESFFASFFQTDNTNDVTFDYKVSHLVHAVDIIKDSVINPDEKDSITITKLKSDEDFKSFFSNNVILVRVEIPSDTDVANYFEIMNNRGEQLQKHEILKAKLMDRIKKEDASHDFEKQEMFSKTWDACSQMDIPIQKLFVKTDREQYFGKNYDLFQLKEPKFTSFEKKTSDNDEDENTIEAILQNGLKMRRTRSPKSMNEDDDIIDDESDDKSIIDFPNFLMHIFKIKYNQIYKENVGSEKSENNIPLNEKDLLSVFNVISAKIDPVDFIQDLLYYRTVFDRYIIKASADEKEEDNYKWSLVKPYKYTYEARNTTSLKYNLTFSNQERIIKCLSLMQVTFRNRKYKNWLQDILIWFSDKARFSTNKESYQKFLETWIFNFFENNFSFNLNEEPYNEGTRTPHFLFNFIDYLYWVDSTNEESSLNFNFDFKYRNSVEHHLPQSFRNEINEDWIDNLGNLCLISKNSNSKMNNEDPVGKANTSGKYYRNNLPPKQKVIYDETNQNRNWGVDEIKKHYSDVIDLLNKAKEILNIKKEIL